MRFISFLMLAMMSLNSFAQVESQITFRGQNAEVIKIQKDISVVRPVAYQVPDTCSRDIPYQARECNDVTRYRNECRWVPASQDCRTEYDRQCRSVTRTRQECTNGPSRQVCTERPTREVCTDRPDRQECTNNPDRQECTNNPSQQVCTNNPDRQVCTDRPSREVCVERPTREVCHTNSRGENTCQTVGGGQSCQTVGGGQSCTTVDGGQSCTTVGGGQTCRTVDGGQSCRTVDGGQSCQTVGGGQSCQTVEGPEVCRNVSYQDQDCTDVPRQACTNIPGRNVCENIPYSEEVCGNVTRYRQESYACERTAYRDQATAKKLTGEIQVHFETNGLVEEFPLQISVTATNPKFESFAAVAKLLKEPKVLVFLKKKEVKAEETKTEIKLQGEMVFEIINADSVVPVFPTKLTTPVLNLNTSILSFLIEGGISSQGSVEAQVTADPTIGRQRLVAELKAAYPSDRAGVAANKLSLNLKGLLTGDLAKKNRVNVKLTAPMTVRGELLNATKPSSEKTYSLQLRK